MRTATRALAAAALTAAALPATAAAGLPRGDDHVVLDPAHFTTRITNPWWPMRPGSRWVYRETDANGGRQRDEFKFYARGVGPVLAVSVSGGSDREDLLRHRRGR